MRKSEENLIKPELSPHLDLTDRPHAAIRYGILCSQVRMFICQECGADGARRDTWLVCLQCLHHNIIVWGSSSYPSSHLHTSGSWRLHSVWTELADLESRNWQFKYNCTFQNFQLLTFISTSLHLYPYRFTYQSAAACMHKEKLLSNSLFQMRKWQLWMNSFLPLWKKIFQSCLRQNVKYKFYKIQKIISIWWHGVWSPGKKKRDKNKSVQKKPQLGCGRSGER